MTSYTNRVTLSAVKYAAFASEETSCFEAIVHFDGVAMFHARNDGRGGSDHFTPLKGQTRQQLADAEAKIKAWTDTLPPTEYSGMTLPETVECVIGNALTTFLTKRDYERAIKAKVLFTTPTKPGVYQIAFAKRGTTTTEAQRLDLIERVKARNPGSTVLNTLPLAEGLAIYMQHATS